MKRLFAAGITGRSPRSIATCAVLLLATMLWALPRASAAAAQATVTQEEALRMAFAGATRLERKTAFLDEAQLRQASRLAGEEIEQPIITHYVARRGDTLLGVAYFDAHRVRTMREVVMVTVTPEARIGRIEILSFAEPPEYRAPDGWVDLFDGKKLSDDLAVRRGIPNITGATLTSRAIASAARRVLALHQVINPLAAQQTGR